MSKLLFVFFLFASTSLFAQYRNFGIGVNYATNNFPNKYNAIGIPIQYNTRKFLSIRSGLIFDRSIFETSSTYYTYHNYGGNTASIIHLHTTHDSIRINHTSIPLLAVLTFGKKLYFSVYGGFIYSTLSKNPYTYSHGSDVGLNDAEFAISWSHENEIHVGNKNECNANYGITISYPINSLLLVSLDASNLTRLDKHNDSYDYNVFAGLRFGIGLSYQFNFSEKSDYTFSNNLGFFKRRKGK